MDAKFVTDSKGTAPQTTITILLGSLEPSEALSSTVAFIRWCTSSGIEIRVLAMHGGTARDQVEVLAPTTVIYDPRGWTLPRIAQRFHLNRAARLLRSADLRRRLRIDGPVYIADAGGTRFLQWLGAEPRPVVVHLHGSGNGPLDIDEADREISWRRTDRWIVGTPEHGDDLVAAGVSPDAVTRIPDLLALPAAADLSSDFIATLRARLVDDHAIPEEAPLVLGVGSLDWWEVPDAFVRVAWEVTRQARSTNVHFLWVADGATERMLWPLRHDIRHAGLEGRVHVATAGIEPWQYIAAADALLGTRLGNHAPLGHRDAVAVGRPVVYFADPEAAEPLVEAAFGHAVAHMDVAAMADRLLELLDSWEAPDGPVQPSASSQAWLPSVGGPAILERLGAGPNL